MSSDEQTQTFETLILVGPGTPLTAPLDEEELGVSGDEDDPTFAQPKRPPRETSEGARAG